MATALTDTSIVIQCMKEGAHDYIVKPFDLNQVTFSIDRALRMRGLELEIRKHQQQLEQEVKDKTQESRKIFHPSYQGHIPDMILPLNILLKDSLP